MATEQVGQKTAVHGGRLVAQAIKSRGTSKLFSLSGGHLFSIYDGCRAEGIDIVDVRHEQSAAFGAEGWAKATREPGVAALTAGPGVTNGMSALAGAQANASPMLVLGGRAPAMRWGMGSLQEIDHVPFVEPLVKLARTAQSPGDIPGLVDEALRAAARRDRPRLGQLQIEIEGGLRPREVQALIRRGLSAEEVADRAGWTVEKVRRFEGPVLAEREHLLGCFHFLEQPPRRPVDAGVGRLGRQRHRDDQLVGVAVFEFGFGGGVVFGKAAEELENRVALQRPSTCGIV